MAEIVKAITPDDVKAFAKKLLDNSYKYEIGISSGDTGEKHLQLRRCDFDKVCRSVNKDRKRATMRNSLSLFFHIVLRHIIHLILR